MNEITFFTTKGLIYNQYTGTRYISIKNFFKASQSNHQNQGWPKEATGN